jgi:hypothetical protein
MIPKSGYRFSDRIMRKKNEAARQRPLNAGITSLANQES